MSPSAYEPKKIAESAIYNLERGGGIVVYFPGMF